MTGIKNSCQQVRSLKKVVVEEEEEKEKEKKEEEEEERETLTKALAKQSGTLVFSGVIVVL